MVKRDHGNEIVFARLSTYVDLSCSSFYRSPRDTAGRDFPGHCGANLL